MPEAAGASAAPHGAVLHGAASPQGAITDKPLGKRKFPQTGICPTSAPSLSLPGGHCPTGVCFRREIREN